ncbi:MAG: glycosyltransferase family 4 protein [Leptospiraceae bacterium]|nr:glycosyltransferase family 4 protein [Leptospiraceae bacterium]
MSERILIGVDARPLAYGLTGNSRYLWEVLKVLTKLEHPFKFRLYSNKPIHRVFSEVGQLSNVELAEIKSYLGVFWLNFVLPRQLKKDKVSLFWGTLQLLPIFPLHCPSIVNYHDVNFLSAPQTMTLLNFWQHKLLSRFTLHNATRILCLSQNTERELHEYAEITKNKTRVVYPGANRPNFPPKELPYKNFILCVGTLEPRKNLLTLVKAYQKLKEEQEDFPYSLLLAGRFGWGDSTLVKDLQSNKYVNSGILFHENPSEEELLYLYRNCEFFVFPSLHEGFGLPLIEAMVEDKCCIASDISVFREILNPKDDLFVPPLDIDAWKSALLNMAKRKEKRRSKKVKENEWNWRTTAEQVLEELWKGLGN